jgi:hypothetical protein
VAPGKATIITRQAEWIDGNRQRIRWENVAIDLEPNRRVLSEIAAVLQHPEIRYPVNYRGVATLLPHVSPLKTATLWFSVSCLFHLHKGDMQRAIEDIEAQVALGQVLEHEPMVISQLVRIAIVASAVQNCWALLQHDNASDAQLAHLQATFAGLKFPPAMIVSLQVARATARDALHMMRADEAGLNAIAGWSAMFNDDLPAVFARLPYADEMKGAVRSVIAYPMWRYAFSFEDERLVLQETQKLVDGARAGETARSVQLLDVEARTLDQKLHSRSWRHLAANLFVPGLHSGARRPFLTQTYCEITSAAIALKRFYMRHGRYPAGLGELLPDILAEIPHDYLGGAPLGFRRDGDKFALWSVGNNGKDDGGTPAESGARWMMTTAKDLVWPQPASEQELAAYLERLKSGKMTSNPK